MVDVPQQDWSLYESLAHESDVAWVRGLTLQSRFAIYEDLFSVIWNGRRDRGNWERLDRWNWDQKLAGRQRLVEAFAKLDQLYRERAAANDSC